MSGSKRKDGSTLEGGSGYCGAVLYQEETALEGLLSKSKYFRFCTCRGFAAMANSSSPYDVTQHSDGAATILFLPRLVLDAHLSGLSDETSIGDLVIPATHDSLALHGCESASLVCRLRGSHCHAYANQGRYQNARTQSVFSTCS